MAGSLFFAASAVAALNYALLPGQSILDSRRAIQQRIVERTASPPDRYRFLVPALVEGPIAILSRSMPRAEAFDRIYVAFYLAAMTALLWSLFAYVRRWFDDVQALIGVLLVACTLPITTRLHEYAPYSFLEPTFFALALLCIVNGRTVLLGLLVAVASLNRETAIFIVLLYAIAKPLTSRRILATLVYATIWIGIFLGTRIAAGDATPYWTIGKIFVANLEQPRLTIFNIVALFGVLWWCAIAGFRRAPPFVRRTALVIPPYLAVIAVWSLWREVRLLLPMMPVLLPLALSYLFEPKTDASGLSAAS